MTIYEKIIKLSKQLGMIRKGQVAEYLGVTDQVFTNWKARGVPPKELHNIASKLHLSIEELISDTDIPNQTKRESRTFSPPITQTITTSINAKITTEVISGELVITITA